MVYNWLTQKCGNERDRRHAWVYLMAPIRIIQVTMEIVKCQSKEPTEHNAFQFTQMGWDYFVYWGRIVLLLTRLTATYRYLTRAYSTALRHALMQTSSVGGHLR